jgi:uncharacterized protein YxjI
MGEIFTLGAKLHVCDMQDRELYRIERKVFSFLPEYRVYQRDMLHAVIKREFTLFRPSLSIKSGVGNYSISGNLLSLDFALYRDSAYIGEIHKKWLSFGDSYELTVDEAADPAFSARW